jgi:hypothetical protein
VEFRTAYVFDMHWSDLLRTGLGAVSAAAEIIAGGETLAEGHTDWLALPNPDSPRGSHFRPRLRPLIVARSRALIAGG